MTPAAAAWSARFSTSGPATPGVLHRRMEDRGAEPQIETEHDAGGANHLDHGAEIGERVQSLQPDHDLACTTGEHLERTVGQAGAGIHHQRAGKAGMKVGELADQGALNGTTLNGVEIGYITFVNVEHRMEGAKQRHGVADPFRDQPRLERRIAGALSRLRVHRNPASEIQDRNDLHG